jgi:hypothetical protein
MVGEDDKHAFNCKIGCFPMKYLGIPIDKDRLSKEEKSLVSQRRKRSGDLRPRNVGSFHTVGRRS